MVQQLTFPTLALLLPGDQATYLVSGTGSPVLTALCSYQSLVLAGFFLLPTEPKLLQLKPQENAFSLAFCSVIPSLEALSMEYLSSQREEGLMDTRGCWRKIHSLTFQNIGVPIVAQ